MRIRAGCVRLVFAVIAVLAFVPLDVRAQTPDLDRERAIERSLEQQRKRDEEARKAIEARDARQRALSRDLETDRRQMIERTERPRPSVIPRSQQ